MNRIVFALILPALALASSGHALAASPVYDWTGFYIGGHVGGGWASGGAGTTTYDEHVGGPQFQTPLSLDVSSSGGLFGAQLGYNKQMGTWVFGIEGDFTGTSLRGSYSTPNFTTAPYAGTATPVAEGGITSMSQDINWLATIRGRLGHTWGQGMAYVTGGLALANIDYNGNNGDYFGRSCNNRFGAFPLCTFPTQSNKTKVGFAIGTGGEYMLTQNWIVRAEYLFYRFDGESASAGPVEPPFIPALPVCEESVGGVERSTNCRTNYSWNSLNLHTLRVGLSYKF
jgi:outer membrane immunogenic protein